MPEGMSDAKLQVYGEKQRDEVSIAEMVVRVGR